jgi:hypothetical protein
MLDLITEMLWIDKVKFLNLPDHILTVITIGEGGKPSGKLISEDS